MAVAAFLAALSAVPVRAQDPGAVRLDRAGTVVRVHAPAVSPAPVEGRVLGLRDGAVLVVGTDAGAEVDVPRSAIDRLEFSTGKRGHPWWGVVVGAIATGIPGAIYWSRECEGSCRVPGLEGFAMGALYYGVLPGFIVGSLIRTHDWQVLPLVHLDSAVGTERRPSPGVGLRITPAAGGGVGVGLRIALPAPSPGRRH